MQDKDFENKSQEEMFPTNIEVNLNKEYFIQKIREQTQEIMKAAIYFLPTIQTLHESAKSLTTPVSVMAMSVEDKAKSIVAECRKDKALENAVRAGLRELRDNR